MLACYARNEEEVLAHWQGEFQRLEPKDMQKAWSLIR